MSLSAIRLCDGRERSINTHDQQFASEISEIIIVAETRQASRPVSSQLVALCSISAEGENTSTAFDRPVALRPARPSAIVVADDFSKSPVCSR